MEAEYILVTKATVRKTAKIFKVGKSTVHKDMVERLKYVDKEAYQKIRKILKFNLEERHIRGGLATKKKYTQRKEIIKEITA